MDSEAGFRGAILRAVGRRGISETDRRAGGSWQEQVGGASACLLLTSFRILRNLKPDRLKPVLLVRIKPLLFPGITVDVVSVLFPETGFVLGNERESSAPLYALPEIQVRNDEAQRVAVVCGERLAVVLESEDRGRLHQVFEGKVGGVTIFTAHQGETRSRLWRRKLHHFGEQDALEAVVEAAPARHAVNVAVNFRLRQLVEFLPGEPHRL